MSFDHFQRLDLDSAQRSLQELHVHVTDGCGRVEITRDGCDDACVMISRSELASLERTIEILSDSEDLHEVCESLRKAVASRE